MKEALLAYAKRVKSLHQKVRGNEQATKMSLIATLFTILGYDVFDPHECVPEFKADFGKDRSVKPVDWAFQLHGRPAFLVEAKDAGRSLEGYDEQLGDYFAKVPGVKLGILTNGVAWQFFTDLVHDNLMDRKPFLTWNVLGDQPPPFDFLALLQRAQFKTELVRAFAQRLRDHDRVVAELTRLLEPSAEFTRLAIANIERRNPTTSVLESWRPVIAAAIREWAKQQGTSSELPHPLTDTEAPSATDGEGDQAPTGRGNVRKRFWSGLLSRPSVKATRHANIAPGEYHWIGAGSGVRGLPYTYVIGQDQGRVELWIDRWADQAEANKRIFDRLQSHRDEIERAFGGGLSWQRLDDKRGCRIAHTVTLGGYKSDESPWPAIQDAMIDAMVRLERGLSAHLMRLKSELASEGI